VLAFLPLKHHSERVPGKNFRLLGDKPLYQWVIDSLTNCDLITEIMIDTDSSDGNLWNLDGIGKVQIKKRSKELIGDFVSMNFILNDYLKDAKSETMLMTHITNPFISSVTFTDAINQYFLSLRNGFDSLFSVNRIQNRFYDTNGEPINHKLTELARTQDLDPIFMENSCIYVFSRDSFYQNNQNRIGCKPFMYESPISESIDIDTETDWKLAEFVSRSYAKGKVI
jgi:CMP-N-acetylneuraminic acid synthetase